MRYEVNEYVEIIGNSNYHQFEIGQNVRIIEVNEDEDGVGYYAIDLDGDYTWYVMECDIKSNAHYKYLRDEGKQELQNLILPIKEWMSKNMNPHQMIIIEYGHARIVSDDFGFPLEVVSE